MGTSSILEHSKHSFSIMNNGEYIGIPLCEHNGIPSLYVDKCEHLSTYNDAKQRLIKLRCAAVEIFSNNCYKMVSFSHMLVSSYTVCIVHDCLLSIPEMEEFLVVYEVQSVVSN